MDSTPVPVITAFDAWTQAVSALCYVTIGLATLLRAPRDIRTRLFFAFALANATAFLTPALAWYQGARTILDLSRVAIIALVAGLSEAAMLLFHLSQVFPRRRAWIRSAGIQLPIAYVLIPIAIAGLVMFAPSDPLAISPAYMMAALVFGFPLLVLLAIVLPVAAIVSFVRSYQEGSDPDLAGARRPIALILIGQLAGGAMALVFAPVLSQVSPGEATQAALTVVTALLGLITPVAFALAVWKYRVLTIDPD
jgi:hypothetical protein